MTTTTNGTAQAFAAVPELTDAMHLEIVQAQIRVLQVDLAKYEHMAKALLINDPELPNWAGNIKRTRAILEGYRTQEAELLQRLSLADK